MNPATEQSAMKKKHCDRTISNEKKSDEPNEEYECTERKNDSMEMKSSNENKLSYKPASIKNNLSDKKKLSDTTVNDQRKTQRLNRQR